MRNTFPKEKLPVVREQLADIDDGQFFPLQAVDYRDPSVLLIVSMVLGSLGIDRFMVGDIGLGILKLITLGGFGVWIIIDWFLIMEAARRKNFAEFSSAVATMLHSRSSQ